MRKSIKGTTNRPRLFVFKSNKHIYAQIIDDINHKILLSSGSNSQKIKQRIKSTKNCETAQIIGKDIADQSQRNGIKEVIFDRGRKAYHGRIKALAEAARKEGMGF